MTLPPQSSSPEQDPKPALEEQAQNNHVRKQNNRNWYLKWLTIVLLLVALAIVLIYHRYYKFYESTDDAYVSGSLVRLNPVVAGSVIGFYADATDYVKQGQLLVQLDKTPFKMALDEEFAQLARIVLQTKQLYDDLQVKQALLDKARTALSTAQYDYKNHPALVNTQTISNEDDIHSQVGLKNAEDDFKLASAQLKIAQDAVGPTQIASHPAIVAQKERVRQAYYQLYHCDIYSPCTGYVAQRNVQVGQLATLTTSLMTLFPTEGAWVDANFKETQLRNMRIGQSATIWFDLYGSDFNLQGRVLGIGVGTGSVFSVIPPQNATGNWIKIVQRIPVRISLDPIALKDHPVRLGISANVNVDITEQDLPYLAKEPPKEPVAITNVFQIDFQQIEEEIQNVINAYL